MSTTKMATNKDKSLSTKKEAINKRPWPNLPQHILNLLARKPNLLLHISYPGTTKSWTTSTKHCNTSRHPQFPQLQDLETSKWCCLTKTLPQFINIYFRTQVYQWWYYYNNSPPPHFWNHLTQHFVGYSRGLLVKRGPSPSVLEVYDVSTRVYWILPQWDVSVPFRFVALSSCSLNGLDRVVVLTGLTSPAFLVYYRGQHNHAWVRHECTIVDPYDAKKGFMKFTNIIGFEGKFYALSLQGALVVMEEINMRLVITMVGKNRAVPCVSAKYFNEYLLESNGEILLVFLVYQKMLCVVDYVEVFRLHFPKMNWIKVESLQGRALFLENECCIWVNSSQVGCRGNCVYFSQNGTKEWCVFDMESGCISNGLVATFPPYNEPMVEE
ncbi:hypothetical protein DH2020_049983 [Rehmannia glutinosa]|uniref:KIB1-4 beta-propeller domain-containing protein n=1 Tax=Rehmannia glutinosa TaxID=99300 RepID=A0ABR0U258_REHGL